LLLLAPRGAQALFTSRQPDAYFVPPYVGARGWLGVELNQGLSWETVDAHVRDAYELVAPRELVNAIQDARIKPPTRDFRPEEIDPFKKKHAQLFLKKLAAICAELPETESATQFGAPVWKAGKKTFVGTHYYTGRLKLSVWVGREQQAKTAHDARYSVSAYTGHNGWIDLDVEDQQDWPEIRRLVVDSYRHFALKRMLDALGA
jgi:predicted DNA-binding protein (MmcQ/YjbR family)